MTIACARESVSPRTLVREIDPLQDPRWPAFIQSHPRASVFHTRGWIEALKRTYGYKAFALTTSLPSQALDNGIVACRVSSWLTGKRIVSLPFSDHCHPLAGSDGELNDLLTALKAEQESQGGRYVEIRPVADDSFSPYDFNKSQSFCMHRLDLAPGLPEMFQRFHKDCVQRKIARAEREGLAYEEGRSELLLEKFYGLMVLTRRRQSLVPQPLAWFRNLIDCMGARLQLHVVSKGNQTLAAMLTLMHRQTLVYKYGGSDKRLSHLGGNQLMFWRAIENAKAQGFREFDLGRSDWDTPGLISFKDRWGAVRSNLTYWRTGAVWEGHATTETHGRGARLLLRHLPGKLLRITGALAYRHLG